MNIFHLVSGYANQSLNFTNLVFQKELISVWVVLTSSVLFFTDLVLGNQWKLRHFLVLTDRWPFLKGDKLYMYDYISAFTKYIWNSAFLDIKRNWTMFGKCTCAYHIINVHINIMPKMNSGPHIRLLHLNTPRRELFKNTNTNITIAVEHINKIIKLIFEKFALQECFLKTEECRCHSRPSLS